MIFEIVFDTMLCILARSRGRALVFVTALLSGMSFVA